MNSYIPILSYVISIYIIQVGTFVSGKKSLDPSHPDYVPSVFNFKKTDDANSHRKMERCKRVQKRRSKLEPSFRRESVSSKTAETSFSVLDVEEVDFLADKATQTDKDGQELQLLKERQAVLKAELLILQSKTPNLSADPSFQNQKSGVSKHQSHRMAYSSIEKDEDMMNFYTGLPNSSLFSWFLTLFKDYVNYKCAKLTIEEHLLLILMKFKLGLLNKDLAFRFDITEQVVSRIFRRWLPLISRNVKFLIVWPEQETIRRSLPSCFQKNFKNCTCIIDCTEIFIERPLNLNARAQTWSNYKHTNTIKWVIPANFNRCLSSHVFQISSNSLHLKVAIR